MSGSTWHIADRVLTIDRPQVMGILNVTPDSFSDGGQYSFAGSALVYAERMAMEGVDIIDVGGESTRPGARPVPDEEELRRVVPVIESLARRLPTVALSVDTTKSAVAAAALDAGAQIVNDVSAFRLDPCMAALCAQRRAGVILMHSRGSVEDMASYVHASYTDVLDEVLGELRLSMGRAQAEGVRPESIVVDPGIGFAKRAEDSLRILAELPRFLELGRPVAVGVSRKRFVGDITGVSDPVERVFGSVSASVMAFAAGATVFRVHDVRAHRQALDVAHAIRARRQTPEAGGA